jgi:sec-independent protein translocase protein TatC
MSEGDPDDERDDEERHDQSGPDEADEPSPDESASKTESETESEGEAETEPKLESELEAKAETDESTETDESADTADTEDESESHPGESFLTDDGDDESTDAEPASYEMAGNTTEDDETADDADDSNENDHQDVTISGGAAAPEPDEAEPVAQVGAPDDQEMPLTQHIEEMIRRVLVVIVVMALVSAVVFPFADRLINFLWYSFLPGQPAECVEQAATAADAIGQSGTGGAASSDSACPRLYHPLSLVLARLKVASLSGFIIALPVFVYETYLFMRPGLYPNERRYYLASVPTSLILAGIGVLFAYLLVLPLIFTYFLGYSQPVADVAFGLSETFGLILLMLGMFAAIFQIPLFIMLAIMMGVTSRRWLEDRRLYFWFGFAGVAFLFSPDPTGMAPFIVALTMVVLFEGTLLLLRWTGR